MSITSAGSDPWRGWCPWEPGLGEGRSQVWGWGIRRIVRPIFLWEEKKTRTLCHKITLTENIKERFRVNDFNTYKMSTQAIRAVPR